MSVTVENCIEEIEHGIQNIERNVMLMPKGHLGEYQKTLLNMFEIKLSHLKTKNWNKFKKVALLKVHNGTN